MKIPAAAAEKTSDTHSLTRLTVAVEETNDTPMARRTAALAVEMTDSSLLSSWHAAVAVVEKRLATLMQSIFTPPFRTIRFPTTAPVLIPDFWSSGKVVGMNGRRMIKLRWKTSPGHIEGTTFSEGMGIAPGKYELNPQRKIYL